ncbi:MAG: hypothetical protein J5510_07840 [Prevotella sp.]|nr:hypothetical protein [Prevotella sp.]
MPKTVIVLRMTQAMGINAQPIAAPFQRFWMYPKKGKETVATSSTINTIVIIM